MRANELAADAAKDGLPEDDADTEDEGAADDGSKLKSFRQAPHLHAFKSPQYWRAVANKHVRTYLTFVEEGRSDSAFQLQVSQSPIANLSAEYGKSCILVHVDGGLLGEAPGPSLSTRPSPSMEASDSVQLGNNNTFLFCQSSINRRQSNLNWYF